MWTKLLLDLLITHVFVDIMGLEYYWGLFKHDVTKLLLQYSHWEIWIGLSKKMMRLFS